MTRRDSGAKPKDGAFGSFAFPLSSLLVSGALEQPSHVSWGADWGRHGQHSHREAAPSQRQTARLLRATTRWGFVVGLVTVDTGRSHACEPKGNCQCPTLQRPGMSGSDMGGSNIRFEVRGGPPSPSDMGNIVNLIHLSPIPNRGYNAIPETECQSAWITSMDSLRRRHASDSVSSSHPRAARDGAFRRRRTSVSWTTSRRDPE